MMLMQCIPYGSKALLVNFKQSIDPKINAQVVALQTYLKHQEGITYQIPAYCSLTIGFDNLKISYQQLEKIIKRFEPKKTDDETTRTLNIPVCYEGSLAPDMGEVASMTGISPKEIIERHTKKAYRVYMMGFIPGFAYMGKVDEKIQCKRKDEPRRSVPAQSVGIAGQQTGIYPSEGPGGWQLIGTTPITPLLNNRENPFLFKHGDTIQFYAIDTAAYHNLKKIVDQGKFDLKDLYVKR